MRAAASGPFATDGRPKRQGLIARHIRTACAEPETRAAREARDASATTAGMGSNASVALVHGMSRPIGAFFHVPHGLSNAMLLPEIAFRRRPRSNATPIAPAQWAWPGGEGSQAAVARLLDELRRLNEDLKVPTPRAYGSTAPLRRAVAGHGGRRWVRARRPTARPDRRRSSALPAGLRLKFHHRGRRGRDETILASRRLPSITPLCLCGD
jgi:hypothetical protein